LVPESTLGSDVKVRCSDEPRLVQLAISFLCLPSEQRPTQTFRLDLFFVLAVECPGSFNRRCLVLLDVRKGFKSVAGLELLFSCLCSSQDYSSVRHLRLLGQHHCVPAFPRGRQYLGRCWGKGKQAFWVAALGNRVSHIQCWSTRATA